MKKVIIVSYFFPPSNFVGSFRVDYWAKNLNKYGYKPIVVTRRWNNEQSELTDRIADNSFTHEVFDTHEIYRLPYKRSLRDRLNDYPNVKFLVFFRKLFSVLELIFSNFWHRYIPYHNLYDFSRQLLIKNHNQYHSMIFSGRPFQLFYFGYLLKKEFGVKWIADYRDEWNTHQSRKAYSLFEKIIFRLEKKSELKWTSNCDAFLGVSDLWVNSIGKFINKKGFTIKNGYDPNDYDFVSNKNLSKEKFVVTYSGTLYATQNLDLFLAAAKKIISEYSSRISFKFNFIGVTIIPEQSKRLESKIKGFEQYFHISGRIPKQEIIEIQINSDLLLTTAYTDVTGCYPVKIFEYYACNTPVLLCPSDNDVIEDFYLKTGCGIIASTVDECYLAIKKILVSKLNNDEFAMIRNEAEAQLFTREFQTSLLAKVLDDL